MEITYNLQYDKNGNFTHIELVQNNQKIVVSLEQAIGSSSTGNNWQDVKKIVDSIADKIKQEATSSIGNG